MKRLRISLLLAALAAAACGERDTPTVPTGDLLLASVTADDYDCTLQKQVSEVECDALVAVYHATGGPDWTKRTNWLETSEPCGWYGVFCADGSVSGLGLWDNNLTGSIPPELGTLSNLDGLNLLYNNLTGSIPPELGNLSNLTQLHLAYNQLSGPIPASLGNLSNLGVLGLASNQLIGEIPTTFGNLSELTQLHLYTNQLTGPIPSELGNLSKLEGLGLGGNRLSGPIPASLGNLANLVVLELQYNELSGPIPGSLGKLNDLPELWLMHNQLSGPIPAELGNLSHLKYAALHDNELSGPIPASLGNLSSLEGLDLRNNQLSGPIPASFGDLTSLTGLWLDFNELSGLVPIEVAELGETLDKDACRFVPGNRLLYMPDEQPYLGADQNGDGYICGLALSSIRPVAIDIKPNSDPNSVNCHVSDEVISVAVLTTDDFDAASVDHTTVTFEGASEVHVNRKTGEPRRHEEDVDEDGDIDLVLHFRLGDTGLTCDATGGTLIGVTSDGQSIEGTGAVRMIG